MKVMVGSHTLVRQLIQVASFITAILAIASGSPTTASIINRFVVVGNDFESSKLCARIVAHILGVRSYGLWGGTGEIRGPPTQWNSTGGTKENDVSVINAWQESVYKSHTKMGDELASNDVFSTKYVVAIRDRTVSARPDLSDSDYLLHYRISDANKTYVWSYEATVLLRTPYLQLMCLFLYSNCNQVDEESLPLPLTDMNRQFLSEKEPMLEPVSTIVNTTAYADSHYLTWWDSEKINGDCQFEQVVVVVGTESSGSEYAAKLVAHALGVAPYGTFDGGSYKQTETSFNGNNGDSDQIIKPIAVWHISYPSGPGFAQRITIANRFRGCDIKFVVTTRDWNIAHLSAMRRFEDAKKWPVMHATAVDCLRDIITKQKSVFILSFEAENVLGGPYYQRLYQFLGLPKEYSFFPDDQKDQNEKYFMGSKLILSSNKVNGSTGQLQHVPLVDGIPVERFIVVSNDKKISDLCTRIVAHMLQILPFENYTPMYTPEIYGIEEDWQIFKNKQKQRLGTTSARGAGAWEAFTNKRTGEVKWITVVDRYLDDRYINKERDTVPHYYGAKNKYIFAIRDPAGASQPDIGNSGYFNHFKIDENHATSYVWSYESMLVLKYPYLRYMCSFLGVKYCAAMNETTFPLKEKDLLAGFNPTDSVVRMPSHSTGSGSDSDSSRSGSNRNAIVHGLATIKGPSDVYVVVGNDDVTTKLCARIVAHLLQIKSFDLEQWDGLGEVGVKLTNKATGQVKWKVVVNGYYGGTFDVKTSNSPVVGYPPSVDVKYIFAIRDPAGASQPDIGNSGYFNHFKIDENHATSYVWSYESMLVLKYPYLRDICWFLVIGRCQDVDVESLPIPELMALDDDSESIPVRPHR